MKKNKIKQKEVTATEYSKIMEQIIEKYKSVPIEETLITLLEEASKYKIKDTK